MEASQQLTVEKWEYPQEFQSEQYDAVLIYTIADRELAEGFQYVLQNFILLDDDRPPTVCLLDYEHCIESSRFASADEAIKRSTYMFMIVTEEFCRDRWAEIQRDECLMETINNPDKRWCFIPIMGPSRPSELPFGIRSVKSIDSTQIFKSTSALTLVNCADSNHPNLTSEINAQFKRNITKLLNCRLNMKRERERVQREKLQRWLEEEQERRLQHKIQEEHSRQLAQQLCELERQKFMEEVQAGKHNQIPSDRLDSPRQPVSGESANAYRERLPASKSDEKVVHIHYHAKRIVNFNGHVNGAQIGDNNQMHPVSSGSESSESDCEYVVRVDTGCTAKDLKKTCNEIPSEPQVILNREDLLPQHGVPNEAAIAPIPRCLSPRNNVGVPLSHMNSVGSSFPFDQNVQLQHSLSNRPAESGTSSRQPAVAVIGPTFITHKEDLACRDVLVTNRDEAAARRAIQVENEEDTVLKHTMSYEADEGIAVKHKLRNEANDEIVLKVNALSLMQNFNEKQTA